MHEMSLCEGILQTLEQQAEVQDYQKVRTVWLEIGALAGVEVEAKISDDSVEHHHLHTMAVLGNIPLVQVCHQTDVALLQKRSVYRMSANRFFG